MSIYQLSDTVAATAQIRPEDIAAIAELGFSTIICNRPDGEDFGQPTADDIAAECKASDIEFHFIPVDRNGLTKEMVESFSSAVAQSKSKVLAYCRSGQRSSVLWRASGSP